MHREEIKLAVSSCLLGHKVRYDGRDKLNPLIANVLGESYLLVPLCPEIAIGLGVPRPAIMLRGDPHTPRAIGRNIPSIDVTDALINYGKEIAATLGDISGIILKSRSPSCGIESTEITQSDGSTQMGDGLFALTLKQCVPDLPLIDEVTLATPEGRRHYLARVHSYHQRR